MGYEHKLIAQRCSNEVAEFKMKKKERSECASVAMRYDLD